MLDDLKTALAPSAPAKSNPYGFLPLLLPLAPLILPVAAVGGAAYVAYKSSKGVSNIFSVPVLIGGGAGYAIGAATKADDKTRIAYAVLGIGVGWAVQKYVISPSEVAAEAAAEAAAHEAGWRWYNPFTWA